MHLFLFIQDSTYLTRGSVVSEKKISIIDLILSGGTGGNIIMGTLAILSIIAIYILIERFLLIKSISKDSSDFLNNIKKFIENKDVDSAKKLCNATDTPISRMLEKGINRIEKPITDISSSIENQGKLEIFKIEHNLANLATISGAAPMIGFLGTVIGMIIAFHEMANAGGNIDVEMLSQGIYTAMTTTVAGLIVGIIAFIAYNFLVSKVDKVIFMMEKITTDFLDILNNNEQ